MADRVALEPLPPREAIAYFRSKGYAPALARFDYRDVFQEEHARQFVVAKAMQDDVLGAIRASIDATISDGIPWKTSRDQLAPRLQELGWWGESTERDPVTGELKTVQLGSMRRLKTIYHANITTAYAAGRWARLQRGTLMRFLEYRQLDRPTARESHMPFDGIILPVDHPLWRKIFPPNGWFCGCNVRPMSQAMLDREGKTVTTDDELAALASAPWVNPRTGAVEDLIDGIDPAFSANPGHAWLETDDRHDGTRLDLPSTHVGYDRGYIKEMAALALRDERQSDLLYNLNRPAEAQPVGMVRDRASADGAMAFTPAMQDALADSETEGVLIRSFPDLGAITSREVTELLFAPGLAQVATVGVDGSIYRISKAGQFDAADLAALTAKTSRAVQAGTSNLSDAERELISGVILSRHLAAQGVISFGEAPSGRGRGVIDGVQELINAVLIALAV